jgi:Icc-related predicted phosphoesterase
MWHIDNIDCTKHRINFGNHDDYTYLNAAHSLGDWSVSKNGIMTVRGADSIDKYRRIEGLDWWPNEELNYDQMKHAIDTYILTKPKIMITHNCPREVSNDLFGIMEKSITTNGLQAMLEYHQPDLWVFGHHHKSKNEVINGTRFICLAELETLIV